MNLKKSVLAITLAISTAIAATPAFAAEDTTVAKACYPTAVTRTDDGTEIRKMYDLGPNDDPAGISRSDFDQDGFHYTLVDLLKQELPENESRQHTETVTVASKSKDMATVLTLLPETKEFITEDGLSGTLALKLDSVKVEVAGYGSSTKELTTTRIYPSLVSQDTSGIPKSVEDNGHELTLQGIDWQTDSDGHFTATATYAGSTTSSYIKGYTVTADYTGTVSKIALNKTRYVAIFEGIAIKPVAPTEDDPVIEDPASVLTFPWKVFLVPVGFVAILGIAVGAGIAYKRKREESDGDEE